VAGYFSAMRGVCDRHGALLILDEVMSGTGRCGTLHAWQGLDEPTPVVPDIETIGKGLGGGYAPVAGMLINHRVADVLARGTGAFIHGQTYQGHPVACAAALAVQRVVRAPAMMPRVRRLGQLLEAGLRARLGAHAHVGDIRGLGLFWGLEFVRDRRSKEAFDPAAAVAAGIHDRGLRHGISLYAGSGSVDGSRGDFVLLAPMYTSTDDEIHRIVHMTASVVEGWFRDFEEAKSPAPALDEMPLRNGY